MELKDEAVCRETYERSVWAVGVQVWVVHRAVCMFDEEMSRIKYFEET